MATNPLRNHFTYTLIDFYRDYRLGKAAQKIKVKDTIPYKKYRGVIEGFLVYVMKKVMFESFSFIIPYGLGLQYIKALKTNNLKEAPVDHNRTKQLKKVVRHLNPHTFGVCFHIKWLTTHVNFKNHTYYTFKATGTDYAKRAGSGRKVLSKHIKETAKNPEMNSFTKI